VKDEVYASNTVFLEPYTGK